MAILMCWRAAAGIRLQVTQGQDALGGTALIVAASNGDLPMLEMLLRAGADAHVTDHDGNMPLVWATHNNHVEAAKFLQDWKFAHDAR